MYFEDTKNIKKNIDHQNFMIDNRSALLPAYFFLYYRFTIIIKFGTQVSRKILNLCDNIEWSQIHPYVYMYSGDRNFSVVKNIFFTPPVKCHMFNVARHYVILPILPRVRCIANMTK